MINNPMLTTVDCEDETQELMDPNLLLQLKDILNEGLTHVTQTSQPPKGNKGLVLVLTKAFVTVFLPTIFISTSSMLLKSFISGVYREDRSTLFSTPIHWKIHVLLCLTPGKTPSNPQEILRSQMTFLSFCFFCHHTHSSNSCICPKLNISCTAEGVHRVASAVPL